MSTANMQVPLYLHYSGAVKRRAPLWCARATPHVQLWVFSKHLQKKSLTLNVIFSIILFMAFGIKIFNANGTSEIFGSSVSGSHFLASGSVSLAGGATSSAITCEGMTSTNTNTVGVNAGSSVFNTPTITRGTGSFTLTNNGGSTTTFTYFAYRF